MVRMVTFVGVMMEVPFNNMKWPCHASILPQRKREGEIFPPPFSSFMRVTCDRYEKRERGLSLTLS